MGLLKDFEADTAVVAATGVDGLTGDWVLARPGAAVSAFADGGATTGAVTSELELAPESAVGLASMLASLRGAGRISSGERAGTFVKGRFFAITRQPLITLFW